MRSKQQRKQKDGSMKKEGMDLGGGLPDPDLPLSQQLEQSFDTIKSHSQSIKVNRNLLHRIQKFVVYYLLVKMYYFWIYLDLFLLFYYTRNTRQN